MMIIIDTSVWIKYFRGEKESRGIGKWILSGEAAVHPFIRGELLLGGLSEANEELLDGLAQCSEADTALVLEKIKTLTLAAKAIGWVDAALLVTAIELKAKIITFDQALAAAARDAGVSMAII